jgi:hypothetical protein
MNEERLKKRSVDIYEELYRKVSLNAGFAFKGAINELIIIDKFVVWSFKNYKHNISEQYVRKFIEIQFNHYLHVQTPYGKGCVMVSWCFGKKAQERYEEATQTKNQVKTRNRISFNLKKKVGLNDVPTGTPVKVNKLDITQTNINEENNKKLFHNSTKGQYWCILYTSLFNHNSNLCNTCKFAAECKQELREQYPNIYKIRGYNE